MNAQTHHIEVKTNHGEGTLTVEQQGRRFRVISLKTVNDDNEAFGFDDKHALSVLDNSSDAYQCFGIPTRIQYGTVLLGNDEMKAQCVEELKAALKVVKIRCFDPEAV